MASMKFTHNNTNVLKGDLFLFLFTINPYQQVIIIVYHHWSQSVERI